MRCGAMQACLSARRNRGWRAGSSLELDLAVQLLGKCSRLRAAASENALEARVEADKWSVRVERCSGRAGLENSS
jgi:hypothetical protein